jgi:hypothetical protein
MRRAPREFGHLAEPNVVSTEDSRSAIIDFAVAY